jgi:hypothetical protein
MNARTPMTKEFFETKVIPEPNSGCWLWLESTPTSRNYGRMRWGTKKTLSHRVAYELYVGPIPEGFDIDHKCKQHTCCNPDHLEAVTHAENMRRARLLVCKNGHIREPMPKSRNCTECYRLRYPRTEKYK